MLTTVTITGADDATPIQALIDLSAEFPFVEWGILVSIIQEGSSRFPSRKWISNFSRDNNLQVSMHVCGGGWVRSILKGKMDWKAFPEELREVANRVQINTHAQEHVSTSAALDWFAAHPDKEFILQLDGVNDIVFDACVHRNLRVTGLFDASHGGGRLPDAWPTPYWPQCQRYGYAGGLGPLNVEAEIRRIREARRGLEFWIDMEGRVRDERSGHLDLSKVRQVLEICAPLMY
jgi:hypothetical protein